MHQVLSAGLDKHVTVYLDDILMFYKDLTSYEQHVQWVFDQLCKHGLKAKHKRREFGIDHLEYLGTSFPRMALVQILAKLMQLQSVSAH